VPRAVGRLGALAAASAGLLLAFFLVARPWYLSWGADRALREAQLPGDSLLWQGAPRETRAIVIRAPAAQVWPWVAQIGQDRAGFYSYAALENLVGSKMKNLDVLIPALQRWQEGDKLWMYPSDAAGGIGQAPLALHYPGRALVFYTRSPGRTLADRPDGTWAFIVQPIDQATSRLVMRGRARGSLGLLGAGLQRGVFEPIHFAMERKMMEGVKARAEDRPVSERRDDLQVLLWALTFGLLLASAVLVVEGRAWRWHLGTFVAAGLLFAVLTLVQPSVLAGVPLVLALAVTTVWRARPQGTSPRR
jgi:hypothetical protein